MSLSNSYCPPRSIHISEEVKFQRQRIDPSNLKQQSLSLQPSQFNALTTLSSLSTKPIQRSVGLYFYRRGLKAGFHGSPTLLSFIRTDLISNWQQYLKNPVLQHPAWLSYPNIKSLELHPRLPICVGYWDGTTTAIAPNANMLQNDRIISDLLRLTDSPKAFNSTQTHLTTPKGSRSFSSILRIAITIHIRPIGEDDEDEENHSQLSVKPEVNDCPSPPSISSSSKKGTSSILSSASKTPVTVPLLSSDAIIIKSDNEDDSSSATSRSTTQEDTPPPSYLPSNNPPASPPLHIPHHTSNSQHNRPATPKSNFHPNSLLGRKRSLTLLSPQKITTRSTRELKRKQSDKIGESAILTLTEDLENSDRTIAKSIDKRD